MLMDLFLTFARVGLFTFGGGYAMISLINNVCVEEKKWITHDEMVNVTVMAESTPGPIAINCATYVGYRKGRLPGAVIATLGMVLPSFLVIYVISRFLNDFLEIGWLANAFRGIKIAVGLLIVDAAVKMIRKMKKKPMQTGMLVCSVVAMTVISVLRLNISSVVLMTAAACVGIAVLMIKDRAGKEKAEK